MTGSLRRTLFASVCAVSFVSITACEPDLQIPEDYDFAHEISDLPVDPDVTYGRLPNGVRYAVRSNDTPSQTASLLMRFDVGSLDETDATRGLAHFLEHMAFNGSDAYPGEALVKRLERLGLAFGADTNASTSFEETIYRLELPDVSEPLMTEALSIFRETAERLTLDPEEIEKERGVILAERRARNSPGFRAYVDQLSFLTDGTVLTERLPIGTEETIQTVAPEDFQAFYTAQYRPEDTFIVLVGDLPVEQLARYVENAFGDWAAEPGAVDDVTVTPFSQAEPRFAAYFDPEIQTRITLSTITPPPPKAEQCDTAENRREGVIRSLGFQILNRRLGKIARSPEAIFLGASASRSTPYDAASLTQLSVASEPDKVGAAFIQAERALRQAIDHGFTQAELDEQLANYRKSLEISVQTSPTRQTRSLAQGLLNAFSGDSVVTTPESALDRFESGFESFTLEAVEREFRSAWADLDDAPQLYLQSPETIEDAPTFLENLLAESRAESLPALEGSGDLKFAYDDFGAPGQVAAKSSVDDIGITTVTFDNGVRLNMKTTPYETDIVRFRARTGQGSLTFPQSLPGFSYWGPSILNQSGLGQHKPDDLTTILAGKAVNVGRSIGPEVVNLQGSTVPEDVLMSMKVLTAMLTDPGLREEAKTRYEGSVRSWLPQMDSTPGGVAGRDVPGLLRSGDPRYVFPGEGALLNVDMDAILDWHDAALEGGAIEVSFVGDLDEDAIIDAVAQTLGALPKRAADFTPPPSEALSLTFPDAPRRPIRLSHEGEPDTALLQVYWPVQNDNSLEQRRKISVLADVLQLELTETLRERDGASYSPRAFSYVPELFPGYGYVGVSVEASPEEIDRVSDVVDAVGADLVQDGIDADTFDRAIKPTLESLETSLENNGYWLSVIDEAQSDPATLDIHRSRNEAYQSMTVDQIEPLADAIFSADRAYRVQVLPVR